MANKVGVVVGLGVGYVLGARAGRGRYEQIRAALARLRDTPVVARPLDAAGERISEAVRMEGTRIADSVADSVRYRLLGPRAREEYVEVEVEEVD